MLRHACLALLLLAGAGLARAEGIRVASAALAAGEEGYELTAAFEIQLNPTLVEALGKGVPLYFVTEFELLRPRWYWFDEKVGEAEATLRLSYNALTRQYRLASGTLHQNFETLEEAVAVLASVRNRPVLARDALAKGTEYTAQLRMRLDVSQLPKPFQVSALTSREWSLASEWQRWKVAP